MNNIGSLLITGGAGFIGSNFIEYILSQDNGYNEIVVIDKLTYASNIKNLELYMEKIIFIEGDICNEEIVKKVIVDYNILSIINFAAESHVDNSIVDQKEFINSNIIGVNVLMNQAKEYWKTKDSNYCRFIQISTDEVYGSSNEDDDLVFTEESSLNPSNPYSATKASADHMINAFINTYKFPAIIIRSSNNYGDLQNEEKFIPKVIKRVINNEDIPLYGEGNQRRCWLYVKENCKAIYKILKFGEVFNVYNISGKESITNLNLVKLIVEMIDKESDIKYTGRIRHIEDRLGHDFSYRISGEKIYKKLDFLPVIGIKRGLREIIKVKN